MKIAIIGAGPSGMMAALQAAGRGADVTLFERNPSVGRKLLVTGSGRCNLTNDAAAAERYVCADTDWMRTLLAQFGVSDLLAFLREIGVLTTRTSDGWYYPLSNSAQTVVSAFAAALNQSGVSLQTGTRIKTIQPVPQGFALRWEQESGTGESHAERVIVAAGGKAYPTLGSRGELFPVLAQLGHTIIPLRPALAPVLVDLQEFKALQGIRLDVGARLQQGKQTTASAAGNLIVTEWGFNGPAVMDISHAVSANPAVRQTLSLNLLHFFEPEFYAFLQEKRSSALPLKVFLDAFFPPKVSSLYLRLLHLPETLPMHQVEDESIRQMTLRFSDTRFTVKGVRDFEFCQVAAGGVPVAEVDPLTLESRRVPGLYLTGETLDVVGPCGGYNLQYAFSSGALAGMAAGR